MKCIGNLHPAIFISSRKVRCIIFSYKISLHGQTHQPFLPKRADLHLTGYRILVSLALFFTVPTATADLCDPVGCKIPNTYHWWMLASIDFLPGRMPSNLKILWGEQPSQACALFQFRKTLSQLQQFFFICYSDLHGRQWVDEGENSEGLHFACAALSGDGVGSFDNRKYNL